MVSLINAAAWKKQERGCVAKRHKKLRIDIFIDVEFNLESRDLVRLAFYLITP